jgi:hypothetical protein
MRFPQTGGCQCGTIRYEIREAPHLVYTCHCTECQRLTGSAFSMAGCGRRRLPTRGDPAVPAPTQARQRAHGHPVGLPGFAAHGSGAARSPSRLRETRFASAPARWTTRLGCVRRAFLDPQRAAMGRIARRGSEVRDAAEVPRLDASRLGVRRSRLAAGSNIGQSNAHRG